jgi:hypothetical protein
LRSLRGGTILLSPSVLLRVDATDEESSVLVLDPRVRRGIEQGAGDGDDAPGEKAGPRLEGDTANLERTVASYPPSVAHREGPTKSCVVDGFVVSRCILIDLTRAFAHERGVGRSVVMLREKGEQSHLHVVEIARSADVIDAALCANVA